MGEPDNETLITITINPEGAKTRLVFRQAPFDNAKTRDEHAEGWGEVLDKLAPFLADFAAEPAEPLIRGGAFQPLRPRG